MRVYSRTIKSTKQISFWLGKFNFWTNIGTNIFIIFRFFVANPNKNCLCAILGHVASAICSIISGRLSLHRIKLYFNFDSSLRFYNSCVNNYFTYCSAPWDNCSTIFCYVPVRFHKRAVRVLLELDFSQAFISLFLNNTGKLSSLLCWNLTLSVDR